jgi:hypothetical protein
VLVMAGESFSGWPVSLATTASPSAQRRELARYREPTLAPGRVLPRR